MTTVLKLGGSVITDKTTPETLDQDALGRAAEAVAASDPDGELVLVHGAGSFGHHHASEHGITDSEGSHDAEGARAVHGAMKRLNDAVLDAFAERGVPALPVHPLSVAHRNATGTLSLPSGQCETMLDEGFVPVTHGDVVTHERKGVTILSGDELVASLAASLDADRVGLCSAVPGVLDTGGAVVDTVDTFGDVADALGGSEGTDVTGGMAGKVHELLALDAPASIFDLGGLPAFLGGENPGTRID